MHDNYNELHLSKDSAINKTHFYIIEKFLYHLFCKAKKKIAFFILINT